AMMWNALVNGNSLSRIVDNQLKIIPDDVRMIDTDGGIAYQITTTGEILLSPDVYHLRGPSRDGKMGLSVIGASREAIGLGLAEQTYGASFYSAGTHVGGVYENPRKMEKDQIDELRRRINEDRGAGKAHLPRILTGGMTYKPDTIPPQDAQYLESRKFTAREISGMLFNLSPHKIGLEEGSTAFASREQANIEVVGDAIQPWVVRMEQEGNIKLLTPREKSRRLFTHMNLDAILRGDAKTRAEFYKVTIRAGVTKINEARSKENLPADPDGDQLMISRDMIPLSKVDELANSQIDKNTTAPPTANQFEPLIEDAMKAIKIRAKQNRARGRPPDKTIEFARLKLEPIKAAHELAGLLFDIDGLIKEG
ncbi:hypothetical protein LCGC14_2995850, partial [marine sediment metagenome]